MGNWIVEGFRQYHVHDGNFEPVISALVEGGFEFRRFYEEGFAVIGYRGRNAGWLKKRGEYWALFNKSFLVHTF